MKPYGLESTKVGVKREPNIIYISSRYYRDPELILGATKYTTNIDIYGQLLFSAGQSEIDQLVELIDVLRGAEHMVEGNC